MTSPGSSVIAALTNETISATLIDAGARPLREEERPLGQLGLHLEGVVEVVQADADDLHDAPTIFSTRERRGASPPRPRSACRRRRTRSGARALPRDGHRPGTARRPDRRHRVGVDGDDAVQPQPPRARRARRGRRGGGRRRRARLQHDRRLRQPVAGDAGHAGVAHLARGDRRLDRADGARARLRRRRLHRRLRQDGAGCADGARARRQARTSSSTAGRCAPVASAVAR